jgi:hypothetical protein
LAIFFASLSSVKDAEKGPKEVLRESREQKQNFFSISLFFSIGLVFPWLVSYFFDVPSLSSSTFGGLPVSSKTMTYIFALQVRGVVAQAKDCLVTETFVTSNANELFH